MTRERLSQEEKSARKAYAKFLLLDRLYCILRIDYDEKSCKLTDMERPPSKVMTLTSTEGEEISVPEDLYDTVCSVIEFTPFEPTPAF